MFVCIFDSMKMISKEHQESKNSWRIHSFIYRLQNDKRETNCRVKRRAFRRSTKAVDVILYGPLETIYSPVEKSHTKKLVDNISVTNGELRVKTLLLKYCFLDIRKNIADHVVRIKIECEQNFEEIKFGMMVFLIKFIL